MSTLFEAVDSFISGDWGDKTCSNESSEKVVCVRGADIENVQGGSFDSIPIRYISSSSLAKKRLKVGDIVIEKSGGSPTQSTGRTCYISEDLVQNKGDVVCSNFCAAFRIKETWDYKYIYYYIQNIYNQGVFFNFEGKTTGIRNLLLDTAFKSIPLPTFDKTSQTKLSKILERIDQKIALNNRMNAELEAMAKQLYDYWFVQFDFPDGNGKPYKSSGGKMVWNEKLKREIPEGWEVKNLFYIAKFTNGIACQNYRTTDNSKLPVIKIKEMHDGFGSDTEYTTTIIPDAVKVHNKDVLFSWSASLEVMLWSMGDGALNQHIFKVTSNNGYPKSFFFYQLLEYVDVFKKIAEARKTTMGHITQDHLEQSAIVIPPGLELPNLLEKKISPIMDNIVKLNEEKTFLTHLRESLLPMLMNGQVTIE